MAKRRLPGRQQNAIQRQERAPALSKEDKRALIVQFRALKGPVHTFVQDIVRQAQNARGRFDDDVYGVLRATLEALEQTGGVPPPLIFGVSHHETGEVEQVGFLPTGMTRIPPGGRFITNHSGYRPSDVLPPGRPGQIEG